MTDYENGIIDVDIAEKMFPGCVEREYEGSESFTMNHGKLATRFIIMIKATTSLTKEEFLANMDKEWDGVEITRMS